MDKIHQFLSDAFTLVFAIGVCTIIILFNAKIFSAMNKDIKAAKANRIARKKDRGKQ